MSVLMFSIIGEVKNTQIVHQNIVIIGPAKYSHYGICSMDLDKQNYNSMFNGPAGSVKHTVIF